jgi:nicotinate dehydrogenase subunit B
MAAGRPADPARRAVGVARRGLGCGLEKGGRVATCAEALADVAGDVRVTRVVTAYECGAVVNPDTVISQIEGGTVMALGGALFESVTFDRGRIARLSLSGYRVPRFTDVPELDMVLLDRPDLPSAGAGETPLIAVAPAIANAIFAATGRRLRSLPLLPEGRVR